MRSNHLQNAGIFLSFHYGLLKENGRDDTPPVPKKQLTTVLTQESCSRHLIVYTNLLLNVKRGIPTYRSLTFIMTQKFLTYHLKLLFAAHHYVFNSKDPKDIAKVLKVKKGKVQWWMRSYEWIEAVSYWSGSRPNNGEDFKLAEQLWAEMIENSDDLSAIDFPDKPFKSPHTGNPKVYALIQSHLFCVDNLSDQQIRERLAEERKFEGTPVRYEGQRLGNLYCWWLYPNYDDSIYSRVFARINAVGDLVVGAGEDTSLVMIRHGRLTLTRRFSDDLVSIFDKRLLVCL